MTVEVVIAPAARRDLRRLDQQAAQRVLAAIRHYLFEARTQTCEAEPPATGTIQARVIELLAVRPRGRAYRD